MTVEAQEPQTLAVEDWALNVTEALMRLRGVTRIELTAGAATAYRADGYFLLEGRDAPSLAQAVLAFPVLSECT